MGPKKKKSTAAAGSGSSAVKAKRKGSKAKAPKGPPVLRVLLGVASEHVVTVEADDESTVGDVRRLAVAAAVAAEQGDDWDGCVLRRHDDSALKRGATTPSQLEALTDDAATLGALGVVDGDPPSLRLDKARHDSDAPEVAPGGAH